MLDRAGLVSVSSMIASAGLALALLPQALVPQAQAQQDQTRPHAGMIRYPDVSATSIVFSYANDLWIAPRAGGVATPLASPPGQETFPRFSPDGTTIAFVGNYDGNRDLYTIPVIGGEPTRVTYHPAGEALNDWTHTGRLLFYQGGTAGLGRMAQLFTVDATGGLPEKLPVPYGTVAAISPDGRWLAYTPHTRDRRTWKRYRGGMATDIWLYDLTTNEARLATTWEGTDTAPMWHGDELYYLSDAGPAHKLNIWKFDPRTDLREQVTRFEDFDIKFPAIGPGPTGGGEIVFQHAAELRLLDLRTGRSRVIEISIPGDTPKVRTRTVDASKNIFSASIGATGKRVALGARGDIWTVPAKKGMPRNLTASSGSAQRNPAWSPDGRWIAYFSDADGEYELYITQSDGKGDTRQLTDGNTSYFFNPTWAPDSKSIAYYDKAGRFLLHKIDEEETTEFDRDPFSRRTGFSFSHDSRWITYSKTPERIGPTSIWLYDTHEGTTHKVTSGMFSDTSPVFDRKGNYLYFSSTRAFSPQYSGLDTTFIYSDAQVILAVPLRDDIESPYAPTVDEETWDDADDADKDDAGEDDDDDNDDDSDDEPDDEPIIDDGVSGTWSGTVSGPAPIPPEGMDFTMTLTVSPDGSASGTFSSLVGEFSFTGTYDKATYLLTFSADFGGVSADFSLSLADGILSGTASVMGEEYPVEGTRTAGPEGDEDTDEDGDDEEASETVEIDLEGFEARAIQLSIARGSFGRLAVNNKNQLIFVRRSGASKGSKGIRLFDINDEKKAEKSVTSGGRFDISGDGKKLLILGGSYRIGKASAGGSFKAVSTSNMKARIDPRQEWKQLLTDAWRRHRDFFYDANMHGVDWDSIHEQYARMLNDAASREDVSYIIGEMIGELNVGHAYYSGGDLESSPTVSVGMLGCDYELALDDEGIAGYRIAKIYRGAPWDSDARGPLGRPGIEVAEGDFLIAINGQPIDRSQSPWAAFQGLAGSTIAITVGPRAIIDDDAHEVLVKPIGNERTLRYRAWIEHNRKLVDEATDGRVGYIYVPNTGINGQNDLFRQFYGQIGKDALIIDERWNGGGQIPTRFIELLNRPVTNYWARRDGIDWTWPPDSHQGPKCMLINGLAGSGGDMFPALFRRAGLGKLIGMRTWGGLVGISGVPGLIDGGRTTVPNFAYYETDGTWGIEGHGVDPDIEVIDNPALMIDGGDPQLEAAIAHMLDELERNPPTRPTPPIAPDRSGMGVLDKDK